MSKRNPFDVLGVRDSATEAEIKKAFRTQSLQLHPDKGGSTEAMQELKEAYDQLKDPSRCRRRDPMIRSKPIIITLEQLHAGDQLDLSALLALGEQHRSHIVPIQPGRPTPFRYTIPDACGRTSNCNGDVEVTIELESSEARAARSAAEGSSRQLASTRRVDASLLAPGGSDGSDVIASLRAAGLPVQDDLVEKLKQRHGQASDLVTHLRISAQEVLCGFHLTIELLDGTQIGLRVGPSEIQRSGDIRRLRGYGLPHPVTGCGKKQLGDLFVVFDVELPAAPIKGELGRTLTVLSEAPEQLSKTISQMESAIHSAEQERTRLADDRLALEGELTSICITEQKRQSEQGFWGKIGDFIFGPSTSTKTTAPSKQLAVATTNSLGGHHHVQKLNDLLDTNSKQTERLKDLLAEQVRLTQQESRRTNEARRHHQAEVDKLCEAHQTQLQQLETTAHQKLHQVRAQAHDDQLRVEATCDQQVSQLERELAAEHQARMACEKQLARQATTLKQLQERAHSAADHKLEQMRHDSLLRTSCAGAYDEDVKALKALSKKPVLEVLSAVLSNSQTQRMPVGRDVPTVVLGDFERLQTSAPLSAAVRNERNEFRSESIGRTARPAIAPSQDPRPLSGSSSGRARVDRDALSRPCMQHARAAGVARGPGGSALLEQKSPAATVAPTLPSEYSCMDGL